MDKYIKAIRENICSICVDSNENGNCTLSEKEICSVEHFLPQILEVIRANDSDDMKLHEEKLREIICQNCKTDKRGNCVLREDANCSLDRYFSIIVETIQKVDALEN